MNKPTNVPKSADPTSFLMRYKLWIATLLGFWGLLATNSNAQSPQWWADNVNWDGKSPYQTYIRLSSAGMGPNALPVPSLHSPLRDTSSWFSGSLAAFHHQEEYTISSFLGLSWRPADWLRLNINVIPLEYFQTSHQLKEERKVFWEGYDNHIAGGDFYVESLIRIPPRWLAGLKTELRIGLKTASGTHLGAARFTDTPGYYVDLSSIWLLSRHHALEIMLGFLAYQTYEIRSRQNDCVLWGIGHSFSLKSWQLYHSLRGYNGYIRNGDAPVVYEAEISRYAYKRWEWFLKAGLGLQDYPFQFTGIGTRWHFHLPVHSSDFQ
jgi:hypothetical protein